MTLRQFSSAVFHKELSRSGAQMRAENYTAQFWLAAKLAKQVFGVCFLKANPVNCFCHTTWSFQ